MGGLDNSSIWVVTYCDRNSCILLFKNQYNLRHLRKTRLVKTESKSLSYSAVYCVCNCLNAGCHFCLAIPQCLLIVRSSLWFVFFLVIMLIDNSAMQQDCLGQELS